MTAVTKMDMEAPVGADLEEHRIKAGLTYESLAASLGLKSPSQARRYALGERWPPVEVLDRALALSGGAVSVSAMHRRRAQFMRQRYVQPVPVHEHPAPIREPLAE